MKKGIIGLLLMSLLLAGCVNGDSPDMESEINQEMKGVEKGVEMKQLLTVEQLVYMAGIDKSRYEEEELRRFIDDYEITADNVAALNIALLLEEYEEIRDVSDVSTILEDGGRTRTNQYTDGVAAIAFYENAGTGSECVYYDLEEGYRYRATDINLFSDLSQVEPEVIRDDQMIRQMEELGVFSWKSVSGKESIDDGQSMMLVVAYEDGSCFRIHAEGILSQILSESYAQVRELLLTE